MDTFEGVISKVYTDTVTTRFGTKEKYSYVINGVKYGAWKNYGVGEGDSVRGTYTTQGSYHNVKHMERMSGGTAGPMVGHTAAPTTAPAASQAALGFPVGTRTKDRSICRQTALKAAVEFHKVLAVDAPEDVLETAKVFEAYITGDADLAEAKRLVEESSDASVVDELKKVG